MYSASTDMSVQLLFLALYGFQSALSLATKLPLLKWVLKWGSMSSENPRDSGSRGRFFFFFWPGLPDIKEAL